VLNTLKQRGVTIMITSHILAELQERVDKLAIMAAGQYRQLAVLISYEKKPICL
jgi:Cu-processing system ATP-binding protein